MSEQIKKGRGRPKKERTPEELVALLNKPKRGRGRPRKYEPEVKLVDIPDEEINSESQNIDNSEDKASTKKQEYIQNYYNSVLKDASVHFGITDLNTDKCTCSMCRMKKNRVEFFRSYSLADMGNACETGERHISVCKRCSRKIFNYLYNQHKDLKLALNHWCQILDLYFSEEIFEGMIKLHNSRIGTEVEYKFDYISDYITTLGRARLIGSAYWDSPFLQNTNFPEFIVDDSYVADDIIFKQYPEEFEGWNKEDLTDYDVVVDRCKYDPFVDEEIEDRRKLYHSFVGFTDEEIADDSGKMNACIDMCRSILRLEKLNKKRAKMEKNDDTEVKEIKTMAELQAAERKAIQKYQQDWGFNRKFDPNKSQGSGTLTGILGAMDKNLFEDALANAYDIKTSNAMQSAAEASWKAIFSQLNISESEFSKIVSDQRESIMKLREELDKTKEDLRLARVKLKYIELSEKAINKEE